MVQAASRLVAGANRPLRNAGGLDEVGDPAMAAALATSGARAVPWMAVPLVDSTGTRNRAIVVLGRERSFNAEDESVLVLLAQMATVALDNARLYQAVQGNEQRLQAVVESSPLAIAELDLSGAARWWNGAAGSLLGWDGAVDRRRARTGPCASPPPTRRPAPALARLWDRTRHGEATVGVQLGALRDDELLQLSVSTAPLLDHNGSVTGILAVAEDVTERQRMLEQFQQAERLSAMARLAGGVAHDFNNLLTVILGCSEILLRQIDRGRPPRDRGGGDPAGRAPRRRAHEPAARHRPPPGRPARGGRSRQHRAGHGAHARPGHRRGRATGAGPPRARWPHPRRPRRDRAGRAEPGHQRPRRHAQEAVAS